MRIKIFTTGGSLDKGYSTKVSAFVVQEPQVESILGEANVGFEFDIEPLFGKDSLEITDVDRERVFEAVSRDPHDRILITHGTDTMVETGRRLSGIQGKTIVLTGAMQPAAFKHTDAHFNIGFALACVQTLPEGVYIAMNGAVFDPHEVEKKMEEDRFERSTFPPEE